jgi:hypothetical protein
MSYFATFNLGDPGDSELARWLQYWEKQEPKIVLLQIEKYTWDYCMDEACPKLGWQGLPDLAGLGVSMRQILT